MYSMIYFSVAFIIFFQIFFLWPDSSAQHGCGCGLGTTLAHCTRLQSRSVSTQLCTRTQSRRQSMASAFLSSRGWAATPVHRFLASLTHTVVHGCWRWAPRCWCSPSPREATASVSHQDLMPALSRLVAMHARIWAAQHSTAQSRAFPVYLHSVVSKKISSTVSSWPARLLSKALELILCSHMWKLT